MMCYEFLVKHSAFKNIKIKVLSLFKTVSFLRMRCFQFLGLQNGGLEFLKWYAMNYWNHLLWIYRIMCYEIRISQNELLSISRIVKWRALNFWNNMLWISEIMCFEFIESCAMKVGFPKMSCFQFLEFLNGVLWISEMVCYEFLKSRALNL